MGVIWTSKTRQGQPQTPVKINWSNPVSRGLSAAVLPTNGLRDVVTGEGWTTWGTTPKLYPGRYGVAWDSTAAYGGLMLQSSKNMATAAQTHILLVETTATSAAYAGLVAIADSANTAGSMSFQREAGDSVWISYGSSGGSPAPTYSLAKVFGPAVLVMVGDSTGIAGYLNGVLIGSDASNTPVAQSNSRIVLLGERFAVASNATAARLYGYWGFNRRLSVSEITDISRNLWQLFAPEKRPLFFSTAAGANNTGTLAVTLDAATLTGVGNVTRSGALATTLDAATLAGVGNVTRSGTLAVTLDAATLSGTGAVTRSGTLSSTLDDVTLAGVGSVAVGTNRDGTLAVTLDAATLAGIGAVTRSGTLAVTLDAATLAGVGTAGQAVTGTLGVTLGNVTLAGIGAIPAAPSAGGGKTFGSNKKKKKQRKAIESEEWLKAEETAKQLLQDRFTKTTPEAKLEALASHIESLQPVIDALKALATADVQEPVQETRTEELTEHQQVLNKFDALITKMASIEELLIIMMAQ